MKTSQRGIDLIASFEGFRSKAYLCPAGVWTIGHGFTKGVRPGQTITLRQSFQRLREELVEYERGVMQATGRDANQNEFDALVCFAFNVGVKHMQGSSVIRAHRRGDRQAAARAFALWNKAGGKVMPGLTRRRAAEAALYLEPIAVAASAEDAPDDTPPLLDMPQAVDPESRMTGSTINRAAALTGTAAAAASVVEMVDTASQATATAQEVAVVAGQVQSLADTLGRWLVPALLLAVVGLAGYIIWQRLKQRREGWA